MNAWQILMLPALFAMLSIAAFVATQLVPEEE